MSLITTVAGTDSTSYSDLTYANDYFKNHWRLSSADTWFERSSPQRERALLSAMSLLEKLRIYDDYWFQQAMQWWGFPLNDVGTPSPLLGTSVSTAMPVGPAVYGQRLQFPRNIDVDPVTGLHFIQVAVKESQCEQAVYLMTVDESALMAQMQGIKRETISVDGAVTTTTEYTGVASLLPPMVKELMNQFVRAGSRRLSRA